MEFISIVSKFSASDWGIVANIAVAFTTLYMAYATKSMARVTQKTLDEQSKPYVIVYAEQRRDAPQLLQIIVENVGLAPAYDIKFVFSENFSTSITNSNNKYIPYAFQYGIVQLVPKQKLIFNWGSYVGIKKSLSNEHISIEVSFNNSLQQRQPSTINRLHIRDFSSVCADTPTDVAQLNEIKKIPVNILNLTKLLDKQLHPQSPEATYMWAYVAWKLLEGKYPREYIVQYGSGAGLTEEQLASAQEAALCLLREYRPELVRDEDFDSNY